MHAHLMSALLISRDSKRSVVVFTLKPTHLAAVLNTLVILQAIMVRTSNQTKVELVLALHPILKSVRKVFMELKKLNKPLSPSGAQKILRKKFVDDQTPVLVCRPGKFEF